MAVAALPLRLLWGAAEPLLAGTYHEGVVDGCKLPLGMDYSSTLWERPRATPASRHCMWPECSLWHFFAAWLAVAEHETNHEFFEVQYYQHLFARFIDLHCVQIGFVAAAARMLRSSI